MSHSRGVEGGEGLRHVETVTEVRRRVRRLVRVVAEAAARKGVMPDDETCRLDGAVEGAFIAGDVRIEREGRDRPTVLARIDVPVDARHRNLAPRIVAHGIEVLADHLRAGVGVLTDVEHGVGGHQELRQITDDGLGGLAMLLVMPEAEGE